MQDLINILFSWLQSFFQVLIDALTDLFVIVVNLVLGLVAFLIQLISTMLPSLSIGTELIDQFPRPEQAICFLNWFFPVDVLLLCADFGITAYLLKFASGPILRFLKITR
jgi:hypothetical protein